MRATEFTNNFNPLLQEFWNQATPEQKKYYFVQDNCYGASQDLISFLEDKGIMTAEAVPIGRIQNGKKIKGWFKADVPDTSLESFTKNEIELAKSQGFNVRNKQDRINFIQQNNLVDEFCWIPHSWVEIRGEILDPSGFYLDGKSGQFDRLVKDKSNLKNRYHYFP